MLKAAADGRTEIPQALRLIRTAHRRLEIVRQLLRKLGDSDEHLPLSRRFRQTLRHMESAPQDRALADLFGQLTLAFQNLNLLLAEEFYPGRTE